MRNQFLTRLSVGIFAAATTFMTTSCKEDVVTTPIYAKAQFVHVAPEAPGVIASVDGKAVNTDSLRYTSYIPYVDVEVTDGKKRVIQFKTNKGTVTSDTLAMNADTTVGYSFYAYTTDGVTKATASKIATDNLKLPSTGKVKVRIADFFISEFPLEVDIEAVAPNGLPTANNHFSAVAFKSVTDFVELAAGSYDFKIKAKGTTNVLATVSTPAPLVAGKIYTMVARGYINKANASGVFIINNR